MIIEALYIYRTPLQCLQAAFFVVQLAVKLVLTVSNICNILMVVTYSEPR